MEDPLYSDDTQPLANEYSPDSDLITQIVIGSQVSVELVDDRGDAENLSITIVPDEEANFVEGRIGEGTPFAKALLGHKAGDVVSYAREGIRSLKIVRVRYQEYVADPDLAARRNEVIRQAVRKSDQTEAAHLSLTVDQKWGDTDPAALENGWE
jgi:hypothetical protein